MYVQHACYLQDYCRPVQAGDLQLLLPQHDTLSQDTAFFMPPLGFNPTQDEAPETEDGHDAATPTDLGQDQAAVQTVNPHSTHTTVLKFGNL